jgi:hydrogenase/urease accessory protein HupE
MSAAQSRHSDTRSVNALTAFLLALTIGFGSGPDAQAHERIGTVSHSIVIATGATVEDYLSIPPALWSRLKLELEDTPDALREYFQATVRIATWDKTCDLQSVTRTAFPKTGNTLFHLTFRCPQEVTDLAVTSVSFLDLDESHVQFARFARKEDPRKFLREGVLSVKQKVFHIPDIHGDGSATLDRASAFLRLGIEHLLTGYDHILFLLTVIIGMSLKETIKAVTSFTLAHSLTMALAFLGMVSLPSNVVEPLIALTIVYVAAENVFRTSVQRRWLLTFFFGLIHGLGFVGALQEITVSREELLLSLVSFNLGIELGQLAVIVVAMPVMSWLCTRPSGGQLRRAFSIGVGALGVLWLTQRILVAAQSPYMQPLFGS